MHTLKIMLLVILVALLCAMISTSCAGNKYVVHPGSINTADSVVADTLLQAKTLLDNTRSKVSATTAPAWTKLEQSYNVVRPAYLGWRAIAITGVDATAQQDALNKALSDMAKAVAGMRKAGLQ